MPLLIGLCAAALTLAAGPADAEVLTVTTATDVVDPDDGLLSLREALDDALDDDTIVFDRDLRNATLFLDLGVLEIDKPLSIVGLGRRHLRIDAQGLSGVFRVYRASDVSIRNLTISGAQGSGLSMVASTRVEVSNCTIENNQANSGGGVLVNGGVLTLIGTPIQHNSASQGGGIWLDPGSVTLINSPLTGNKASSSGGGFASGTNFGGSLKLINSRIEENSAGRGGGIFTSNNGFRATLISSPVRYNSASSGGGLYSAQGANTMLINSNVRGNWANNGGGIYLDTGVNLTLYNSRVVENEAAQNGGGIWTWRSSVMLSDSRVARNRADGADQGQGVGGGVFELPIGGSRTLELVDSAVVNNIPDDCAPPEICL